MNSFYEELFKTQKSMLDSWKNFMDMNKPKREDDEKPLTMADYFASLANLNQKMFLEALNSPAEYMENFKKLNPYDNNLFSAFNPEISQWKSLMGINDILINNAFKSPTEIWANLNNNFNSYISAYQLYKNLINENGLDAKSLNEKLNKWKEDYSKYLKTYLVPMAPADLREPIENYIDMANNAYNLGQAAILPWFDEKDLAKDALFKAFQAGPENYFNYLVDIEKKMMDSLNRMDDTKLFGVNPEILQIQKKAIDRATKYSSALGNYYQKVYEVINDASKESIEQFQKAAKEGLEPKTFEEFYNFLNKKTNEFIDKSLKAENFNQVIEKTLRAVEDFKEESDDLNKEYYSYLQLARKKDFVKLEDTIEKLNERIETLCDEIERLKEK